VRGVYDAEGGDELQGALSGLGLACIRVRFEYVYRSA
jgi:hypothetical protein